MTKVTHGTASGVRAKQTMGSGLTRSKIKEKGLT